jgi:hypothetical protein
MRKLGALLAKVRQLPPSSSYSSFVLDIILVHEDEHEDEYEKYQIGSHAYALSPQPDT